MTLEDALVAKEITPESHYPCFRCAVSHRPFALLVQGLEAVEVVKNKKQKVRLADPTDPEGDHVIDEVDDDRVLVIGAVCTNCLTDDARIANVIKERADKTKKDKDFPWESDLGLHIKAERNRRVDAAIWAVNAATSPLTPASQQQFAAYIQKLHRLTIDYDKPDKVKWPTPPTPAYP